MTETIAKGSCLCGAVTYKITGTLGIYQYCHCSRCRKFTGASHSASLLVKTDQFEWLTGEDSVGYFEVADAKYYNTAFCKKCGSSLPWQSRGKPTMIIPAGTLDDDPGVRPQGNIYYGSTKPWLVSEADLPHYDELPPRK